MIESILRQDIHNEAMRKLAAISNPSGGKANGSAVKAPKITAIGVPTLNNAVAQASTISTQIPGATPLNTLTNKDLLSPIGGISPMVPGQTV